MATIQEGKAAPAFRLEDARGKSVSLADFAGKNVILYFYPRDDTPGCTKEACGFRDAWKEIGKLDAVVLGVSADGAGSHQKFIAKYKLPFPLLSDPDRKVMKTFGAYGEKMMYGKKTVGEGRIVSAAEPVITAQCFRVPVSDGHMAAVFAVFEQKPAKEEIVELWKEFSGKPQQLGLPSAPRPFLHYFEDEARPQTRLDRDAGNGQAVTIGRLRPDTIFDWRFVALSHNTVRGAAGGAVLTAELLSAEGWIEAK